MKRPNYITKFYILIICTGLAACSNYNGDRTPVDTISADPSSTPQKNAEQADSLTIQKTELSAIYTQAIAEFIKAAYKNDQITFDTLYFGKHVYGQADDFPDIELPATIENTQIRLVSPELGQIKQAERHSLVYVNMMGWVDKEKAAFVLVVFKNGGEHQYDYFIDFNFNNSSNKFELDKIGFENYLHLKGQKPKRKII
ncbi:MAG: hypothetical protein ORN56_01870 [Chitinophagales bacterium]|nr:hypothetical protein [Chitinophagales bacterium]